ncbi:MAG: hypothetical protein ACI9WS_002610 [Paraglaciecola psychrophila]|jgi:hypothetical protein
MMVFALRGYFLGFVPLLARLVGYGATYYLSQRYADDLAVAIAANTAITLGPIALGIGSAIIIFVSCMLVSALLLSLLFALLSTLIPPLKRLFERRSLASKLLGAVANSMVAAIFVLTGAWAYQLVSPNSAIASIPLSQAVNWVGGNINAQLLRHSGTDLRQLIADNPLAQRSAAAHRTAAPASVKSTATGPGSAIIVSSTDPSRRLSLGDSAAAIAEDDAAAAQHSAKKQQNPPTVADTTTEQSELSPPGLLETLLNSEALRGLINNPKIQQLINAQFEQSDNENTQTRPEP